MALSNMAREPRREITESIAGTLVFIVLAYGDYHLSLWFQEVTGGKNGCPWQVGLILCPIFAFGALYLAFVLPHWIGEEVCDALARRGFELRPKNRSRR